MPAQSFCSLEILRIDEPGSVERIMKLISTAIAGFWILFTGSTALAQDDVEEAQDSEARVCVNSRAIRNFDAFTDQHVYVREGSTRHFLFTMSNRCPGLRNANGIAIKDTTSRVCSNSFGEIVYRDRMGGMGLRSCRIGKIEVVESKEDAKAIVEAGSGNQ